MKSLKILIISLFCIITVAFTGVFVFASQNAEKDLQDALENRNYKQAVNTYNSRIAGREDLESECQEYVDTAIKEITLSWTSKEINFKRASNGLKAFRKINNKNLKKTARTELRFVKTEHNGNVLYAQAEKQFKNEHYFKALKTLVQIDEDYSQYNSVSEFKGQIEEILVALISSPTTEKEYTACQKTVEKYIEVDDAECFELKKHQLDTERDTFMDAEPFLKKASASFNNKKYGKSFLSLESGLEKYPDNKFLADTLEEYHNIYLVCTAQKAKSFVEEENYDKALDTVEKAIENYPESSELLAIKEYIKESKNPIYKAKNNIKAKLISIKDRFTSGDIDVEQARRNAGEYVTRSGKKLVLGDYSEDEITILSASGEIITSIIGVDAAIDVRDLSYDLTHWGEEDYFAVRLATDAVALVPVIGAVKYLKYSKEASKGVKGGIKTAKGVIGGTTAAAKKTNRVLNQGTSLAKDSEQSAKITTTLLRHYKKISTENEALAGKVHPVTGVPFKSKHVKTPDGRRFTGVFAKFTSKVDIQLPKGYYRATGYEQKNYLLKDLQKQLKDGKLNYTFTDAERKAISEGRFPDSYDWHPSEDNGLMQLVDKSTLENTECTNGKKFWGRESPFAGVVKNKEYYSRDEVAAYLKEYKKLPPNFVTESEAKAMGIRKPLINPSEFEAGKHLGGDLWENKEEFLPKLPEGKHYIECDVDYYDKSRGENRIVFTDDFEHIYYTDKHYAENSWYEYVNGAWKKM